MNAPAAAWTHARRIRPARPLRPAVRGQAIVVLAIWPFLAAALDIVRFPRWRSLAGFVAFCAFAGYTFLPIEGSDGWEYARQIRDLALGLPAKIAEPIPAALVGLTGRLGLDPAWYFAAVGTIYGLIVSAAAKRLFLHVPRDKALRLAGIVFAAALFLNHPVFSAVGARYHLGLWAMMLATLFALERRWAAVALLGALAFSIHYGMALFLIALIALFVSRNLGPWQVIGAYVALIGATALPVSGFTAIGNLLASSLGGSFGAKVAGSVAYAELAEMGGTLARSAGTAWFLQWGGWPLFYALLVSGHAIWWRIRHHYRDPQCQLWILIVLMWAVMMAVQGEPEAFSRVQRNCIALLLLFHARWFLFRIELARFALLVNIGPLIFYFIVYYRRWLEQASLVAFLPSVWAVAKQYYPRALELLFG